MAEASAIEWTDSTFNPWIGCTEVGPGCKGCYARELAKRYGWAEWGPGKPRIHTAPANWRKPVQWNARDFYECRTCGWRGDSNELDNSSSDGCPKCLPGKGRLALARRRVFCASLADVFDNEVDETWRANLFALIYDTPNLDWLLLTKRIGNVEKMVEHHIEPGKPWRFPPNAWLGATVVNQEEADRDIPKLMAIPARVRFLSCEPLLGPLDLVAPLNGYPVQVSSGGPDSEPEWQQTGPALSWVIVGGESGTTARPMRPEWARAIAEQCHDARVPFLFKQWGEWAPREIALKHYGAHYDPAHTVDMAKMGKKHSGRELDGREWNGFPETT